MFDDFDDIWESAKETTDKFTNEFDKTVDKEKKNMSETSNNDSKEENEQSAFTYVSEDNAIDTVKEYDENSFYFQDVENKPEHYFETDVDKILENIRLENENKINQKDKYRRDSINVIDQALLNKKKREAEQLKLDQKKNEFQSLLKKAQYNLGNKYAQNYGVINTQSGFLKKEDNTLMFGKSLKENEQLLKIKLPNFDNFSYLNLKVSISGKYNDDNVMYLGIASDRHYWAIQRGPKKNLQWHYDVYNNNEVKSSKKKISYLGSVEKDLSFNIEFDRIKNLTNIVVNNGNKEVEWIPKNSIIPINQLYVIIHRGNKNDTYLIDNIQIDINKSYPQINNSSNNLEEPNDTTDDIRPTKPKKSKKSPRNNIIDEEDDDETKCQSVLNKYYFTLFLLLIAFSYIFFL